MLKSIKLIGLLGMGSHINFLINTENNSKTSLKGIVIGGMRLESSIQKKFEKKKFKINVLKNYGLTETSSLACCDKPNSKIRKHGASGIPMIGNTIKILIRKIIF